MSPEHSIYEDLKQSLEEALAFARGDPNAKVTVKIIDDHTDSSTTSNPVVNDQ